MFSIDDIFLVIISVIKSKFSKCELLCSNCHQEHHHPDLNMKNVPEMISKMESEISENKKKKSFSNRDDWGNVCPICGTRFPKVKGKIYCSKECREIFKTCSNYEGNLISIEDAYNKLIELNVDVNKMKKSVRESVNKIMEYKPISKEIVTEDVIEEQPRRRRRRRTKSISE